MPKRVVEGVRAAVQARVVVLAPAEALERVVEARGALTATR